MTQLFFYQGHSEPDVDVRSQWLEAAWPVLRLGGWGTYVPDVRYLLLSMKQGGIQPAASSLIYLALGVRLSDAGLTATVVPK